MSTVQIIESLYDSRKHIPDGKLKEKEDVEVTSPDFNIAIMFYSDHSDLIEVGVFDKETGKEWARHVFAGLNVFSDFMCNAFTPPANCEKVEEQAPYIIEHKYK